MSTFSSEFLNCETYRIMVVNKKNTFCYIDGVLETELSSVMDNAEKDYPFNFVFSEVENYIN